MGDAKPPVKVSGLIKLSRWSLLFIGIFYGAGRQERLARREVKIREKENRIKAAKAAHIAEERRRQSEKDVKMLSDIFQTNTPSKKSSTCTCK